MRLRFSSILLVCMVLAGQAAAAPRWPGDVVEPVLTRNDEQVYDKLLSQAKRGIKPSNADLDKLNSEILLGVVQAQLYLSDTYKASFSELANWLRANPDMPAAVRLYEAAEARRPATAWRTETIKTKLKTKKGQKQKYKTTTRKVPTAYAEMPPKPRVLLAREEARRAAEAANARELASLSAAGRETSGRVWRLRSAKKYEEAQRVLLAPGSREALTDARWQTELVRLADYWHGKGEWSQVSRAAEAAARAKGPERDEALWFAGLGAYRSGQLNKAAEYWSELASTEPKNSTHYSRAAWWAARVYDAQGKHSQAKAMLEKAAEQGTSFYGQLAAKGLKRKPNFDWREPQINKADLAEVVKMPAVRRGLALAQLGETALAQQEFRSVNAEIPFSSNETLAALALKLHLPGLALQMGRSLYDQNIVLPAALYPVPAWKPTGGLSFDHALMLGIMRQESAFMPAVGSRVGAQGLMQLMPATANYVRRMQGEGSIGRTQLHHPATNMQLGQTYLKYLSDKLNGNLIDVVAAYNGGAGSVQRWHRNAVGGTERDPLLFIESIPFDETRDYVEKVFANYWIYQERLGGSPWSLQALAEGNWPVRFAERRLSSVGETEQP